MFLLFVALLVAMAGPAQAMVVCVGENGHVDIELALGGCYLESPREEVRHEENVEPNHYGCVGCTDFLLDTWAVQTSGHRLKPSITCSIEILASGELRPYDSRFSARMEFEHPCPSPTLGFLATVVLLN